MNEFRVGDRVRLRQDMCKQMNLRSLHGIIINILSNMSYNNIIVRWDNGDTQGMYPEEISKMKG